MSKWLNIAQNNQIAIILSALVFITLALPLWCNMLAIYLLSGYSILTMITTKQVKANSGFLYLCAVFFVVHGIHLFTDQDTTILNFELERKLSFVLLPLVWTNLLVVNYETYLKKVLLLLSYGLNVVGLSLVLFATYRYSNSGDSSVFYYHKLVEVFDGNAIYYSLLFLFSLLCLFESYRGKPNTIKITFLVLNTSLILLLSSKTFVFIMVLLYLFYLSSFRKAKYLLVLLIVLFAGSLIFNHELNITNRYADLDVEELFTFKTKQLSPTTHFDGLSLRKELWRMGIELSTENTQTFFWGVGPGEAQHQLDQKMMERKMYTGEVGTTDTGFLGYNFHNQYLQTLVEVGVVGLVTLLFIFMYLFYIGFKQRNRLLVAANVIFLLGFLTESFLSRQVGVVTFISANSLLILSDEGEISQSIFKLFKRGFDIVFSLLVIVFILSWLIPLLSLIIFIDTRSTPFFVQKRMGQGNKPFNCLKFKTMIDNADADHKPAQVDDVRITRLGRFLRTYSIDELPQFLNVFWGDMSVVGPRPLMLSEEEKFSEVVTDFSSRLKSKPGVTGLAQAYGHKGFVSGKHDVRIRYRLDLIYSKEQSLKMDLHIILKTITYLLKQ